MLFLLELAGIGLGLVWILMLAPKRCRRGRFLARAALVAASAWAAEESCIRLYGFYSYHQDWHIWVGRVPLLVPLIWPVIIFSAMDLVSHFSPAAGRLPILAGAAVVASDALFIEPLSAAAGLWHWSVPGLFSVPPIGILGWFFFAGLCIRLLSGRSLQAEFGWSDLQLLLLPAIGTHLLLLLSWWGALRWINAPLNSYRAVAAAWFFSFVLVMIIRKRQIGLRVQKRTLLLRLPAAVFFFMLILRIAQPTLLLPAYALAFVPPYALLMMQQYRNRSGAATRQMSRQMDFD